MRTIAALALLISVQAWACPDLTGTFTCTYQDGSQEVVNMSQELKNGVTVYNYNGTPVAADNVVNDVPDDESLKQATFRAWCDDNITLKAELKGKYYSEGNYFGDLLMNMEFTMVGNDLKQVSTGSIKNSGGDYPLNGETLCTRNP